MKKYLFFVFLSFLLLQNSFSLSLYDSLRENFYYIIFCCYSQESQAEMITSVKTSSPLLEETFSQHFIERLEKKHKESNYLIEDLLGRIQTFSKKDVLEMLGIVGGVYIIFRLLPQIIHAKIRSLKKEE
jgi:hypothetical protein